MRYGYWLPVFGGCLRIADAPRVVGFDPFAKLADYLEELSPQKP
jgi:hypothetical protein